jgi:ribosomal protein L32
MDNTTGLYIRRRYKWVVGDLWQLFLGGYTRTKPSELSDSYLKHFKELHNDYEWVVLERRWDSRRHTALYRIGCDKKVKVYKDIEIGEWEIHSRFRGKEVECLSLWHMDEDNKMFEGSISNRVCPRCVKKEYNFLYYQGRKDERNSGDGFSEA